MPITHPTSVVQSTELPSLSTDRHLVYPLKASFAPLKRGIDYRHFMHPLARPEILRRFAPLDDKKYG